MFYYTFLSRNTRPDFMSLIKSIRVVDSTAGPQHEEGSDKYVIKVNKELTSKQLDEMQIAIDTAPQSSMKLTAEAEIDVLGIKEHAIIDFFLDELNILRSREALPAITKAEAVATIRLKAGVLGATKQSVPIRPDSINDYPDDELT